MPYYKDKVTQARQQKKTRRRRSKGRTLAIVLASLAGLLVLIAAGVFGFLRYTNSLRAGMFNARTSSQMQKVLWQRDAADQTTAEILDEKTNEKSDEERADWVDEDGSAYRYRTDVQTLLVMGIDYMNDPNYWDGDMVSNGGNADILALVILDSGKGRLSVLYIPRDTMVNMLQLDEKGNYLDTVFNNISASHSYGDGGELSCELTADAVSKLLYGVPVTRFAAMDYDSIPVINQALGGLEITFPEDYSFLDYNFLEGATVKLSDYQLQRLIRYRDHSQLDSATQRGLRDLKLVVRAMAVQAKGILKKDPAAAMTMYNQLKPYMTSNLTVDEISYLAQQLVSVDLSGETIIQMPGVATKGERYAEFYPDEEWLHDFVIETFCEKVG